MSDSFLVCHGWLILQCGRTRMAVMRVRWLG